MPGGRLPNVDDGSLAADVERISASAHEVDELRLLNSLRTGALLAKPDDVAEIERLVGTSGTSSAGRLGLSNGADAEAVAQAAAQALAKWQRRSESPMSDPEHGGRSTNPGAHLRRDPRPAER